MKAVDVARKAGVSSATVSLVINGKAEGRVSPDTQARVERAIADLGYQVNPVARSLATGRRHCIALIAADVSNPFISTVAAGVASELGDEYQLLLAVSGAERALPDIDRVLAFGVDGVLVDLPIAADIRRRAPAVPLVALDDPTAPHDVSRVHFGIRQASRQLVEHLVELGHRSIVYLDSARPWATFKTRREGIVRALRRAGVSVSTVRCDINLGAARELVLERWSTWETDGITAIVAAADVMAYGVVAALVELGVDIPGTVSIASFDGLQYARITDPPLTTVSFPAFELGATGARLLVDALARDVATVQAVELAATFSLGGSTGVVR